MNEKLDLHGIRHEDARQKVITLVEDNWNIDCTLEIITGHSSTMRSIVTTVLGEYDLGYASINQGSTIIIFLYNFSRGLKWKQQLK